MKVLICTDNPYGKIGGGESFYRRLVESSQDDHFYFFGNVIKNQDLPPNVSLIPRSRIKRVKRIEYKNSLSSSRARVNKNLNEVESSALGYSMMIAEAIRKIKVDHIHIPEYEIVGSFLKDALQIYGKNSITTSTFIHGGLSQTIKYKPDANPKLLSELQEIEEQQRMAMDQIFAFKFSNIEHVEVKQGIVFLDPSFMVSRKEQKLEPLTDSKNQKKPILILAGRYEPVKGFEQILNLYPYLSSHFSGIEFWNNSNKDTDLKPLRDLAKQRDIELKIFRPSSNRPFFSNFPDNGLLVIPSLFDNLNLMALDAANFGIPLIISKEAGASRFLADQDSRMEEYIFDPFDTVSVLSVVRGACKNYSELRKVVTQISNNLSKRDATDSKMIDFENVVPKNNRKHFQAKVSHSSKQYVYLVIKLIPSSIIKLIKESRSYLQILISKVSEVKKNLITQSTKLVLIDLLKWIKANHPVLNHIPIIKKISGRPLIYGRNHTFALYSDRASIAQEFKRALVFQLRLIRDSNISSGPDLDISIELAHKAKDPKILKVLSNAIDTGSELEFRDPEFEVFNPAKGQKELFKSCLENQIANQPKLEIIVSSYAAKDKLPLFLQMLSLQNLVETGDVRVVFVDANSPELDFEFAFEIACRLGIGIKSFQMRDRISIQEAWNFGIKQSTAPYLVFLGTDEAVFPSNLEGAIAELERDIDLDWITYSSFASEVDSKGRFKSDKGSFDRSGFTSSVQYLDSSYVNFVGGVLRKSIFERFGYFDGSFKGAGDTEFKSRVMKNIKVKCHPTMGGQFLDYPEERTTASIMAEIEDFVAWYNFRRGDALRKLGTSRPEVIREIYELALGYRKSYAAHKSTDIFMACRILELNSNTNFQFAHEVSMARDLYKKIFSANKWQEFKVIVWTIQLSQLLRKIRKNDNWGNLSNVGAIRLDNSLEQHGWIW